MSIPEFNLTRRSAFRSVLADLVTDSAQPKRRPPQWSGVAAFALAGILTGGAVSAAAATFGADDRPVVQSVTGVDTVAGLRGVPAPPGIIPGSPIISLLGLVESFQLESAEDATQIDLEPPTGATHVRVTVQCLSAGSITWGLDGGGNNPSSTCSAPDVGTVSATSYYDFSLGDGSPRLYVDLGPKARAMISIQYVNQVETAWGVNAAGETYGTAAKPGAGEPDLVAVTGTDPNGVLVDGYVRATDLESMSPMPTSEADASTHNETGRSIPVYESDGRTRIASFHAQ